MARDTHICRRFAGSARAGLLALACVLAVSQAPGLATVPAYAQEGEGQAAEQEQAGFATVAGVDGVAADAAFSSLDELAGALADCELPGAYTVYVSGTLPASEACELPCAEGGVVELAGVEGTDAYVAGASSLACAGSLELSGLAFDAPLAASARGGIAVADCSFAAGLALQAGGDAVVSGCSFAAEAGSQAASGAACSAVLASSMSALSFDGNAVEGFARGVTVTQTSAAGSAHVSVCGNVFALAQVPGGPVRSELALAGGPWACAQVSFDANEAASADALVVLSSDFSLASEAGRPAASLASGELGADAARVFEVASRGTGACAQTAAGICADDSSAAAAAQTQAASDAAFPSAATVAPATCAVTYDGNGATAGTAPAAVTCEAGARVTLATCSSLVRPGSEFRGWNTQPDGSGVFYAAGQVVTVTESLALYAQWSPVGTVANVNVSQGA